MLRHSHNPTVPLRLKGNLIALLVLACCGCSSGRYTTMYLNQLVHEKAEQEVKIESMSIDLQSAQEKIMSLELENQRLREANGEVDPKPVKSRRIRQEPESVPAIDNRPKNSKPEKEKSPTDDLTGAPDLEISPIEEDASPPALDAKQAALKRADESDAPPDAANAEGDGAEAFLPAKAPRPVPETNEGELPDPKSSGAESSEPSSPDASDSSSAVALAIDKSQTRGEDLDGQPGDEGVLVVLQPRDAAGKYVPQVGTVVIEVVDSPNATKNDSNAQVAEWKFTQEEVRRATRNSTLGRGAYLSVDWDEHRPTHERLLIVARWKSPTGEELTTEQVVRVNLSKSTHAWDSRLNKAGEREESVPSVATRPSGSSSESKSWAPTRR